MEKRKRGRPRNPNTPVRVTTKDLLARLEKHEAVCTVQLENIQKQLDEGSKRFEFLQNTVWGLYAIIVATGVLAQFV